MIVPTKKINTNNKKTNPMSEGEGNEIWMSDPLMEVGMDRRQTQYKVVVY